MTGENPSSPSIMPLPTKLLTPTRHWFKIEKDGITVGGIIRGTAYREKKYALFDDPCVYCFGPATTIEHITPKSRGGGKGGVMNHAAACKRCNNNRSSTPLLRWLLKTWRKRACNPVANPDVLDSTGTERHGVDVPVPSGRDVHPSLCGD